jgi:hypothetical protein
LLLCVLSAAVLSQGAGSARARGAAGCGLPSSAPVWVDYAEPSVAPAVRAVFARPGVVVASSGSAVPADFRSHGAATTYFELHLPSLVGSPGAPADPATVAAAADRLFDRAVASTACAAPWIALNELQGSELATPWSASNAAYRGDVLALVERLAARGASPFLFIHGNPNLAGDAAQWWRQVAQAGTLVYELYFNAAHISELGPVLGNRRMRMGGRLLVSQFAAIGIKPERVAIALGFHSSPQEGVAGRQGLQPREAWFRVVKWEALAAHQFALETGIGSIWSWGWAAFSTSGADPDKPAAACVYLWTRDPSLCDAPAVVGPAFDTSLTEGQIVLPPGVTCAFAGGQVTTAAVDALARVTHERQAALSALFGRAVVHAAVPIRQQQILAVEREVVARSFHGRRRSFLEALTRAHATLAVARDLIGDELRRRAIAARLASSPSPQTTLEWTADRESSAVATATCLHDTLPGYGNFPQTDAREVGVVPTLQRLPFLFRDRTPPATPAAATATTAPGNVIIAWQPGPEPDLAGYQVYRSATSGGPYTPLGPLLDRPTLTDSTTPAGRPSFYVVRAYDTSHNASAPTPEVTATPG